MKRRGFVSAVAAVFMLLGIGVTDAATNAVVIKSHLDRRNYGWILEGPRGFTLYVFCHGPRLSCTGRRASAWPPLIAHGRVFAAAGSNIKSRKLGTRKLGNGERQVTYYGQPLYLYKGDHKPAQTNGENTQAGSGAWFVIGTRGVAVPPSTY